MPKLVYLLKTIFAFTAYLLATTLLLPFLPLRLWWRARKAPAYAERIAERFGFSKIAPEAGGIWVHAVSVGETLAIAPAIKKLLDEYPEVAFTVTTTTPTGSGRVQKLFGSKVSHVYAPYDWPLFVWLFLRRVKPGLLVIVETELWPVTIALCQMMGIRVWLANGHRP